MWPICAADSFKRNSSAKFRQTNYCNVTEVRCKVLMHEERGRFIAQQQRGGGLARIRRRPADGIIKIVSVTPHYCPFHKLFAIGTKLQNDKFWQ
jgi:hypothetical protein